LENVRDEPGGQGGVALARHGIQVTGHEDRDRVLRRVAGAAGTILAVERGINLLWI